MATLARDDLRRPAVAAVATVVALAAVAIPAYRLVGPTAAVLLVVAGALTVIVLLLLAAGRRLRRTRHDASFATDALEAVPRAVFIVDALEPGRPNRFVNEAFSTLTGYGREQAVSDGFDATAIFGGVTDVAALTRAARAASPVTLRRSDGSTVAAKLELRPISDGGGQRYLLGMLEEAPGAPAAPTSGLARVVDQSASSNETARPKNAFLSWLTHELRSPLNACVMWLDVLALAPPADKIAQGVDAIKRNLTRQTRLVNDLSDASKILSAPLEVAREPLDLVELIKTQIDAWQLLAIGRQLTFAPRIEAAAAVVDGDGNRLAQAMNHLVENAIASTPAGGRVELRVRLAGQSCVAEVEDTGVGLSSDDTANLGTPLWRAPATSKSRPGLGLGLAIAHHIAAAHGGALQATSNASGVVFTLTLPLAAPVAPSA